MIFVLAPHARVTNYGSRGGWYATTALLSARRRVTFRPDWLSVRSRATQAKQRDTLVSNSSAVEPVSLCLVSF